MGKAHRIAWELTNGPIPEGAFILHHCDNPPCCNPRHLYPGDSAQNSADMVARDRHGKWQAAKVECKHGHPLVGGNLYITPNGRRQCRICNAARTRKYREGVAA